MNTDSLRNILSLSTIKSYSFRKCTQILQSCGLSYRICYKSFDIWTCITTTSGKSIDMVLKCGVENVGPHFCKTVVGNTFRCHSEPHDFRSYIQNIQNERVTFDNMTDPKGRLDTNTDKSLSFHNLDTSQLIILQAIYKMINKIQCSCHGCNPDDKPVTYIPTNTAGSILSLVLTALKLKYKR